MTERDQTEIKVFVSCPGDVRPEKEIIKQTCESLNRVYRETGSVYRFAVLDWSEIVASWGNRPQQDINDLFDGYNIYIGILWMRFGSKTGKINTVTGVDFGSGTYEEFTIAVQKFEEQIPIELYFFFKDGIAANSVEESEQRTQVLKFRQEISSRGWTNVFKPNEESIFTNKINNLLEKYVRNLENKQRQLIKNDFLSNDSFIEVSGAVARHNAKWAVKLPPANFTIPRSFSKKTDKPEDIDLNFGSVQTGPTLSTIVLEDKRVAILGTAGSGKSTELIALANHYSTADSPFVPLYRRLNNYVDESLEEYLPSGWSEIPPEICLILLDGLDEVQPVHFNTAIKRISSFTERHPEISVVVSCRTNFYDFINAEQSGTLPDFNVYHINPLNETDLEPFLRKAKKIDSEIFFAETRKHGYDELILQPFFLNIIISEYQSRGNLKISKSALLAEFMDQRIILDQDHFKNTIDLRAKKQEVLKLLEQVAMVMETTGRNAVSSPNLLKIVGSESNIQLLRYCTAFNLREEDGDSWSFEHNNIQEYLAAKYLGALEVEKIKALISYDLSRIKPSWVNTLFFLIGIVAHDKKHQLIDWMVEIEPEILIRMEPEHIDEELRMRIFSEIFNQYKAKELYVRSNKFSNVDLARFAPQPQAVKMLITEFRDQSNSRVTRLTSLHLLRLMDIPADVVDDLHSAILTLTLEHREDSGIFASCSRALISMNMINSGDLTDLMAAFGESANQDIRAGIYDMILELNETEKYVDYLLEGTGYLENGHPDRSMNSFFDEEWALKSSLLQMSSNASLIKVFNFFGDPSDARHADYMDKEEILTALIDKAISSGTGNTDLFDSLIEILINYGNAFDARFTQKFAEYFLKTNSQVRAFETIYEKTDKPLEERCRAISAIADATVLEHIKGLYAARELNKRQITDVYYSLQYVSYLMPDSEDFNEFEKWITLEEKLVPEKTALIEPMKVYDELQKKDFQLYFDKTALTSAISSFFRDAKITNLTRTDLRKYRSFSGRDELRLPEPLSRITARLSYGDTDPVTEQQIVDFVNDDALFIPFTLNQIYLKSGNKRNPELNEAQREAVTSWVTGLLEEINVQEAIKYQDNGTFVNITRKAILAWYFIRKLGIPVSEEKMLEFSLLPVENPTRQHGTDFTYLEKHASKAALIERVKQNLTKALVYGSAWRSHAIFVIKNKLVNLLPLIIDQLVDPEYGYAFRSGVLKELISDQYDPSQFMAILSRLQKDGLRWEVVAQLKTDHTQKQQLTSYLNEVLETDENSKDRLEAAKVLAEFNELNGFIYFTNEIIKTKSADFHGISLFQRLVNPAFIERLIEMSKLKIAQDEDGDNRVADLARQGLWSIGVTSESNLNRVIKSLKEENADHSDFIERMQDEFYVRYTQSQSLESAIQMIKDFQE